MDQRLALGACAPQIAPLGPPTPPQPTLPYPPPPPPGQPPPAPPPPPPKGASGQRLVGGYLASRTEESPPPPPRDKGVRGAGGLAGGFSPCGKQLWQAAFFSFFIRLNSSTEYSMSSQATAWVKLICGSYALSACLVLCGAPFA